jgi:anti-anti-sigma factor
VSPDLLPQGSIEIQSVEVDGKEYDKFDARGLTVEVPTSTVPVKIKVRIAPTQGLEHFTIHSTVTKHTATLTLAGELDHVALPFLIDKLDEVVAAQPERLVIRMKDLRVMSMAGVRALIFAKQKMRTDEDVQISGARPEVRDILDKSEFGESVNFTD